MCDTLTPSTSLVASLSVSHFGENQQKNANRRTPTEEWYWIWHAPNDILNHNGFRICYIEEDIKNITRCLGENEAVLRINGYTVLQGNNLREAKLVSVKDIDVPKNTPQLGIFDFRSFPNIGMLLTRSEKAKKLRYDAYCGYYYHQYIVSHIPDSRLSQK